MLRCPVCGSSNQDGAGVCGECGASMISEESIRCPRCGILNPPDNRHCESCGARLVPLGAPRSPVEPKSDRDLNDGYPAAGIGSDEEPADQMPLKGPSLPGSAFEETSRPPITSAASGASDWLSDLRSSVPDEVYDFGDSGTAADLGGGDELPDWVNGDISAVDAISPGPAPPGDAVFDGLMPEDGKLPNWLQEIRPEGDTSSDVGKAADWEGSEAARESSRADEASDQAELPVWLRQAASASVDAEQLASVDAVDVDRGADADALPDWLRDVTQSVDGETGSVYTDLPVVKEAEYFSDLPNLPGDGVPEPTAVAELTDLPSWLRDIMPSEVSEYIGAPSAEADSETETTRQLEGLDWLGEALPTSASGAAERAQLVSDQPDAVPADSSASGRVPPSGEPVRARPVLAETAASDTHARLTPESPENAGVPDWLSELVSLAQSEDYRKDEPIALASEMQREAAQGTGSATRSLGEAPTFNIEDDSGLATALGLSQDDFPEWLKALRPVSESLDSEVEEEAVEIGGVLDGLRGVIPAAPAVGTIHTGVASGLAGTPDSTIARAQLLQGLLARTPQVTRSVTDQRRRDSGLRVWRWLVELVIVVVVLVTLSWPYLTGNSRQLTRPRVEIPGVDSVFDLVDGVGPSDALLVAFEYGPAEAEELDLLATAVLRHVVAQGARIRVVSTRPEGSAMAVRVMKSLAPDGDTEGWYDLIGYRPGGATAVSQLLFASDIDTVAVLVLTANPVVLRWWVEQAQLLGESVPVAAGVSAGLEPVAIPYFDGSARQLSGMVSGLTGAAYYEQTLLGFSGQASHRLDALAAGHLAVVGLIVIGALIHVSGGAGRKGE
ncbi:MAG: zinc ribbon domain-containing protein [Anaerolineae bacterium]|nr:zinc ribbon domain-containing protein [Anaerolineae bacterium]